MSDLIDDDSGSGPEKHGQARSLVEAALRARRDGDNDRADTLLDQARRTDPSAVEDLLMEIGPHEQSLDKPDRVDPATSDREVAEISRMIQPNSDAPPRAGISDTGSGADNEGL